MKNLFGLKRFFFLGMIVFFLILSDIAFVRAQKTEEANWGVQIPETSANLYGMPGYTYVNMGRQSDVYVDVVKLAKRPKDFYNQIQFVLGNPDIWVGFHNVSFYNWSFPDEDKPYCIFPEGCDEPPAPLCMECFLNKTHPRSGYSHLRIAFMIFNVDMETLPIGQKVQATNPLDTISFSVWYTSDCSVPDPYHNMSNWVRPAEGLWIERISENTWRISVDQDLDVNESYCEMNPAAKGKRNTTISYHPLTATAHFNFQMDFIKNP